MYIKDDFIIDGTDEVLLHMKTRISKLRFYSKMYILAGKPKFARWEGDLAKPKGKFRIKLQNNVLIF